MEKAVKDKWLEALRSGEYRQTQEVLCDQHGMCCLGVLLHVNDMLVPMGGSGDSDLKADISDTWSYEFPTDESLEKLGLDEKLAKYLAEENDNGTTFRAIADLIEARA